MPSFRPARVTPGITVDVHIVGNSNTVHLAAGDRDDAAEPDSQVAARYAGGIARRVLKSLSCCVTAP